MANDANTDSFIHIAGDNLPIDDVKHDGYGFNNAHDDSEHLNHALAGAGHEAGTIFSAIEEKREGEQRQKERARNRDFATMQGIDAILASFSKDIKKMTKEFDGIEGKFKEIEAETVKLIDEMKEERTELEEQLTRQQEEIVRLKEDLESGNYDDKDYQEALIEEKLADRDNTQTALGIYTNAIEKTENELNEARSDIRQARQEIRSLNNNLENAQDRGASQEQIDAIEQRIEEAKQTIRNTNESVEELTRETQFHKENISYLTSHLKNETQMCAVNTDVIKETIAQREAQTALMKAIPASVDNDHTITTEELKNIYELSQKAGVDEQATRIFAKNLEDAGIKIERNDGTTVSGASASQYVMSRWEELKIEEAKLIVGIEKTDKEIVVTSDKLKEIKQEIAANDLEMAANRQELQTQVQALDALSAQLDSVNENIAQEQADLAEIENNVSVVEQALEEHGSIVEFMASKHSVTEAITGVKVEESELLTTKIDGEDQYVYMDSGSLELYTISIDEDGNQVQNFIEDPAIKMDLQAQIFEGEKYPSNFVSNAPVESSFDTYYGTMAMSGLGAASSLIGSTKGMTTEEARQISQDAIQEQKEIIEQQSLPALEEKIKQAEEIKAHIASETQKIEARTQQLNDKHDTLEEKEQKLFAEKETQEQALEKNQEQIRQEELKNGTSSDQGEDLTLQTPKYNLDEIAAAENDMKNLLDIALTRSNTALTTEEYDKLLESGIISEEKLNETAINMGVMTPDEAARYESNANLEEQPTPEAQLELAAAFNNTNPEPTPVETIIYNPVNPNPMGMRA